MSKITYNIPKNLHKSFDSLLYGDLFVYDNKLGVKLPNGFAYLFETGQLIPRESCYDWSILEVDADIIARESS